MATIKNSVKKVFVPNGIDKDYSIQSIRGFIEEVLEDEDLEKEGKEPLTLKDDYPDKFYQKAADLEYKKQIHFDPWGGDIEADYIQAKFHNAIVKLVKKYNV